MISLFLRARHWQIFSLIIGLPFVGFIFGAIGMIVQFSHRTVPWLPIAFIFLFAMGGVFILLGWIWSVSMGLQKLIPEEAKSKTGFFRFCFFYPMIYIPCFIFLAYLSFFTIAKSPKFFTIIIPFHLFAMFCIFYCIHFMAKTIKTAEMGRKVTFSEYAGEFVLAWMYMIGIWILQPRINSLVKDKQA